MGLAVDRHLPEVLQLVIAEDHRLVDHLPCTLSLLRQPCRDDGGIDRGAIVEPILAMEAPLDLHFEILDPLVIDKGATRTTNPPLAGLSHKLHHFARNRVDGGFLAAPLIVHGVLIAKTDHARHSGHFAEAVRPLRPAEGIARLQLRHSLSDERNRAASANTQNSCEREDLGGLGVGHRKVPCYGLSSAELPTFLNHRASIFQNNSLAGSGWIGRWAGSGWIGRGAD